MKAAGVAIRPVRGAADCEALIELCAGAFPEEARATGMPIKKWRDVKAEDLMRSPELWRQCGVAVLEGRIIGAIVLTVDDEPDAALSYWQLTRRAGCLAALRTMCYDQVLEEALQPHECLVDFLAVSAEARGKGVGALLMEWAERTAGEILAQRVPQSVAAHGVLMTLWVAADNDTACRLYSRLGYSITKRTGEAPWSCLSSRVFQSFLGHPKWHKMSKPLPAPAPGKPAGQTVPVAAPVQAAIAVAAGAGTTVRGGVAALQQVQPTADPEIEAVGTVKAVAMGASASAQQPC